jgi:citrate lyase subunit beta/citryl-CoA lyase
MTRPTLECDLYDEPFFVSNATYEYLGRYAASSEYRTEFKRRSHLFVPLNKPRFLEKIGQGEVPADGIIWDLEDSVPANRKQQARDALAHLPKKPWPVEYSVRINCGTPEELELDLAAISGIPFDSVTLPKGESALEILRLMRIIGEDKAYIVTIETLQGLFAIDDVARVLRPGRDALGIGVGDLSTDLEVERISTCESQLLQQILGTIAITARRYHLDLFDGVSARFNDPEAARQEAMLAQSFGFTGKKLINPKQLEPINKVFAPSRTAIVDFLATLDSFLDGSETNAHVVGGEYKGMPAFKTAERAVKKFLRQGYLKVPAT